VKSGFIIEAGICAIRRETVQVLNGSLFSFLEKWKRQERVTDDFQNIVRRPSKRNSDEFIKIGKVILWDNGTLTRTTRGPRTLCCQTCYRDYIVPKIRHLKVQKFRIVEL
jgi:hypothetical protein